MQREHSIRRRSVSCGLSVAKVNICIQYSYEMQKCDGNSWKDTRERVQTLFVCCSERALLLPSSTIRLRHKQLVDDLLVALKFVQPLAFSKRSTRSAVLVAE